MKIGRSTLPLPRYTRRKRLKKGGFGYFFDVPTWARERGCPVKNEPLGMETNESKKSLKTLERVKGIEPSYSA